MTELRVGRSPGRVNLIGDHTDYMGGLVLPMAIQFGTTIEGSATTGHLALSSDAAQGTFDLGLPLAADVEVRSLSPSWGRHVAAVAELLGADTGIDGTVSTDLPLGAGLSSSAALSVAAALALDAPHDDALALAELCQRAEQVATGVPCGIMDQMAVIAARRGHALMIDCASMQTDDLALPDDAAWWVVHSGQGRELAGSAYAERRAECERALEVVGHLPVADPASIERIADPVVRRRARHVRSECERVRDAADALRNGDLVGAGRLMTDSHRSLRDDFEVSSPALDATVAALLDTDGVFGARLTGAGFGGCVVALARPGADIDAVLRATGQRGWKVEASSGALELLAE